MTSARRNHLPHPESPAAHAGLILACYLQTHDKADARIELLEQAIKATKEGAPIYKRAFERWKNATSGQDTAAADLRVLGRLIVGLGRGNVLETGIMLHHTYGTPIIPGSALKGLAAHYCHRELGSRNPALLNPGTHYRTLFGTTDDSGCVIFHDSWIYPDGKEGLVRDIMTPHHGDYYSGKSGAAPTDFDDPNPVAFLSVTGKFRVAVSCQNREWAEFALRLLKSVLKEYGIGGKTNAGYGRMGT